MNAITQAMDTIEKLQREVEDAKKAFRAAWTRAEQAEAERAEARSRTDEYIRLNVALSARIERMEAWIKAQGHRNHACFERVNGEAVRHRSGRCECGYDSALAK